MKSPPLIESPSHQDEVRDEMLADSPVIDQESRVDVDSPINDVEVVKSSSVVDSQSQNK